MNNITLNIEKDVFGGFGLGYHDGKTCFIEGTVSGDTVEAQIYEEKKNLIFGTATKVITASEDRITALCKIAKHCGGCSYQHISYKKELLIKKQIIEDSLMRIGSLDKESIPPIETISGDPQFYRSHGLVKIKNNTIGFFKARSNDLVPLPQEGCLLMHNEINSFCTKNNENLNNEEIKIAVDENKKVIWQEKSIVTEKINDITYSRSLELFFQANRLLRQRMIDEVIELCDCNKDDIICDAHCGVGLFSLPLAKISKSVRAFDINKEAVKFAKRNAKINSIKNIDFSSLASSQIHPQRDLSDIVVLDPPRGGCDKKTRKTIMAMKPKKIVYVSCDPATYSRDVKDFITEGYKLKKLYFIDMFPRTYHIEIMSLLERP